MKTSALKPGLLVSLKTSVRGGVDYQRQEIGQDHTTAEGERVAKWETTRTITDPAEYERAVQARGKARNTITTVCCDSSFGLLCPDTREQELQAAIEAARQLANDYNKTAAASRIEVYVLLGRVAQNDVEAARAISAEVRELLDDMKAGITSADPEIIRDAANKARQIGGMLTDETAAQVSAAVNEARKAARDIVKRVEKAGEQAGKVVAELSIKSIEAARFAFLDMGDTAPVQHDAPAARSVDLSAAQPNQEV